MLPARHHHMVSMDATDEDRLVVLTTCPDCRETTRLGAVSAGAYAAWDAGIMVQAAFPDLTPGERERLMTGICEKCWDSIFKDGDGDEGTEGEGGK